MDFEPSFKVHNLVSVQPESIILGEMTNLWYLNMIFHVLESVYRFVKIWNSPQFPVEFRNGQLVSTFKRYKRNLILVPDFYTLKERKGFFCANTKYRLKIKRNCVKNYKKINNQKHKFIECRHLSLYHFFLRLSCCWSWISS